MKNSKNFFGCMNFNRTVLEEHKEPLWEPQWKKPALNTKSTFGDDNDLINSPLYSGMSCNIHYREWSE